MAVRSHQVPRTNSPVVGDPSQDADGSGIVLVVASDASDSDIKSISHSTRTSNSIYITKATAANLRIVIVAGRLPCMNYTALALLLVSCLPCLTLVLFNKGRRFMSL